ncbi:MAG: hypothetical protein LLG45_13535 [Actinomycetia bacterium]|nr:hypothetical protein [Actinomycetes bacterium]
MSKYGRYVVTRPKFLTEMAHHDFQEVAGFTFPDEVYIDQDLIGEANQWLDINWIWDKTIPRELPGLHSHPFAEIVLLIGSDPRNLRDLGGEVQWGMGEGEDAETFVLTSTTAIYVPAGLPHGPLVYRRVDRPILNIAIGLNTGGYA